MKTPEYRFKVTIGDYTEAYTRESLQDLRDFRDLLVRNLNAAATISPIQKADWKDIERTKIHGQRK